MKVEVASSAGHGRPNEDFVGATDDTVVLLDGAGIPGAEAICRHGVAWYAQTLGATLLDLLSRTPQVSLVAALAEAIDAVAGQHRGTCDLRHPNSPQATVAIVRVGADHVDHLVLADTFVVLDRMTSGPQVVTDPREVDVRRECSSPLRDLTPGSPDYERALPDVVRAFRARRNQPGGYWIAKDDPAAASSAVTGSTPLASLGGVALLSNGAARFVSPYRLGEWRDVMDLLRSDGPGEILRRVRHVESSGSDAGAPPQADSPDDASVGYCAL